MADIQHGPITPTLGSQALTLPLFVATLFTSAFLLFWIQPLATKMMLPLLGGVPAVWNTAMMLFQLLLLAAYGYAHLLTTRFRRVHQPWVHAVVVLAALAVLPIRIGDAPPAVGASPILWLIGQMLLSVGLPFFALAASAPLLQKWFVQTGHHSADDPYFLYGASNLGSLLALIAFPFLLEPRLSLGAQSRLWTMIYGLLIVLLCACALSSNSGTKAEPKVSRDAPQEIIATSRYLHWIALAFVPSSLLLGVTTFISTDVAAVPLLWTVPLALYLLSFVFAFARRPPIRPDWVLFAQAVGVSFVVLLFVMPTQSLGLTMAAHYGTFFFTALMCHAALAKRRPPASALTTFYLCISLGGALGGVFNAVLAPLLFSSDYEYPLVLCIACLFRPLSSGQKTSLRDGLAPFALFLGTVLLIKSWSDLAALSRMALAAAVLALPTAVFLLHGRALRFALAIAAVLLPTIATRSMDDVVYQERNFFGVKRVKLDQEKQVVYLLNGTTLHGAESIDRAHWRETTSYYARQGPIGQLFGAWRQAHPAPQQVALIGLGIGSLVCYAHPEEAWTYYEIDPAVERIARDPRFFHYLEQCGARASVVLGDGRLSLRAASTRRYDLLVLDAFSSDAIPLHLLTREAFLLYLDRITEHGLIVLHISNKHLQLAPMLSAMAQELGLAERHQLFVPSQDAVVPLVNGSEWVVLARREADLSFLANVPLWRADSSSSAVRPWTDDFSNILDGIRW